jgi:hypothetical protein
MYRGFKMYQRRAGQGALQSNFRSKMGPILVPLRGNVDGVKVSGVRGEVNAALVDPESDESPSPGQTGSLSLKNKTGTYESKATLGEPIERTKWEGEG